MPRVPVDTSLPMVALQPVAAPVQSFIQAPRADPNAGGGLMDIARSLSNLSGPLNDYIQAKDDQQAKDDALKAQEDFVKNNSTGYDEAVKQGLIPASASPSYVNAWKKAQGDVAGAQLEQEAITAYEQWPGKTSEDPAALNQFVTGFLKDRLGASQDPRVLAGLMPRVKAIQSALQQRHLQDMDQQVRDGAKNTFGAQGNGAIDDAHAVGLADGKPNYDAAFAAIEEKRKAFGGMTDEEAQKVEYDLVTGKAIEKNDPEILKFFDRKVPGHDYTYRQTPDGQKAYDEAVKHLDIIGRQKKVEDHQAMVEADRVAKNKTEADALEIITKDPKAPLPDTLNQDGRVYNGAWDAQVQTWRKQFSEAGSASDPAALSQLNKDIMDNPDRGTELAKQALTKGTISPSDFQTTYKFAQDVERESGAYAKALQLPQVTTTLGVISQRTAPGVADWQAHPNDLTNDGLRAQSDYRQQILQWMAGHPEDAKDPIKLGKAIDDIGASILGHITPSQDGTTAAYAGPDGGKGNAFGANAPPAAPAAPTPTAAPAAPAAPAPPPFGPAPSGGLPFAPWVAPPAPPPVAPTPAPTVAPAAPAGPTPQQVDGWFQGLPPESQKALGDAAAQAKDPAAFKAGVYQRWIQSQPQAPAAAAGKQSMVAPDGTAIQPAAFTSDMTPGQVVDKALSDPTSALTAIQHAVSGQSFSDAGAQSFETALHQPKEYQTMSTLKDDPKAGSILDFISKPEAGGNYNAQFGHAGSTEDLSQLTVGQVLAKQRAQAKAGAASVAIGRYQFIGKTLRNCVAALGISQDTKFTPELQDRMALYLLQQRGYDDWKAGKLTDQQFANNLAKEWASLPVIGGAKHGRSYYAGDGLNKALVSPSAVLRALEV